VKEEIAKLLKIAVQEATGLQIEPQVTPSSHSSQGDYSSNAPMIAFGMIKDKGLKIKDPKELAEKIKELLTFDNSRLTFFDKVEVAGPGFLNFYLSQGYFGTYLYEVLISPEKIDLTGQSTQKVVLEFGDPNPFKQLHIGHVRNLVLGESYARILESLGNEVIRANYQGDIGLHVAKAIWGILQIPNLKSQISNLQKKATEEKAEFLGKAYAQGAKAYEEDKVAKVEIEAINKRIYEDDPEINLIWKKGRKWSLEEFEVYYKRLGVKYVKYYFESQTAPRGKLIVQEHINDKIFEEHEGAVVFRGPPHTRVFITREGFPTYEAKDLALALMKKQDLDPDLSIIMTGNEQVDYFKVILSALKRIDPDLANKTRHVSFGFVTLAEGKMSSREGNVVTAKWLLEEAKKRIKKAFPDTNDKTLEAIAVGCVKYSMLKFGRESDIKFSFDESINLEGNSGVYLQYTFARIESILRKVEGKKYQMPENIEFEPEERELLRHLLYFREAVEQAGREFAPNILCNYLYILAQKFNLFYQKHKVIGSGEEQFRLGLVMGVGKVLKTGLNLLGIEVPAKI